MMTPALHGLMATLLRRESRALEHTDPAHAADLYAQSVEAEKKAGIEGMTDGDVYLFGWTDSIGGEP